VKVQHAVLAPLTFSKAIIMFILLQYKPTQESGSTIMSLVRVRHHRNWRRRQHRRSQHKMLA